MNTNGILAKMLINTDICLYNSLHTDDYNEDIWNTLDDIAINYDNLFGFACTLAAFQFVGIVFDKNILSEADLITKTSYFFLALGFIISLLGALTVFVSAQFIRSLRYESRQFIIGSMEKYKGIFFFGQISLYMNSVCFLVPVNIIIHELLDFYFAITLNIASIVIFIVGLTFYACLIARKQVFKVNNVVYQRKIYD